MSSLRGGYDGLLLPVPLVRAAPFRLPAETQDCRLSLDRQDTPAPVARTLTAGATPSKRNPKYRL